MVWTANPGRAIVNPRTRAVFDRASREGRAALIAYLPAGFPTVTDSIVLINEVLVVDDVLKFAGEINAGNILGAFSFGDVSFH